MNRLWLMAVLVAAVNLPAHGQTAIDSFRTGQAAFQREDYWSAR